MSKIQIPQALLPADGRFGSGPSKIPDSHLESLAQTGRTLMGTSHRQPPVKDLVQRVRSGLAELFTLPEGYEVILGNGGSAAFFDLATYALIRNRSQHAVFGEFGKKFAKAAAQAPWLQTPTVHTSEWGQLSAPIFEEDVDVYAWTHNETSTGVMAPVVRPAGATPDQLVLVDATSAAGGLSVEAHEYDVYYFAPQKSFASDGGLWFALMSPLAIARAEAIAATERHIPSFFRLTEAMKQSRLGQTVNTPAVATLILMEQQIDWMLASGGLGAMAARTAASAEALYTWAEKASYASPFVTDPTIRSHLVGTIEFDADIDVSALTTVLRHHGIVDTDAYRGVGSNQLRIAMYPAVDASDVEALTACIDYVAERL